MDKEKSIITATRLRELRKKRGLSHVSLSKEILEKYGVEISRDTLMNYEATDPLSSKLYKNEGMRLEYLRCFVDFYNVSADYILGNTNASSKNPAAVDELGLSESAVNQIMQIGNARGFEDCVPGLNFLIDKVDILLLGAFVKRFCDSVEAEDSSIRNYRSEEPLYSDPAATKTYHEHVITEGLEEMVLKEHPELAGHFHISMGSQMLRMKKEDIVNRFAEKLSQASGYNEYLERMSIGIKK